MFFGVALSCVERRRDEMRGEGRGGRQGSVVLSFVLIYFVLFPLKASGHFLLSQTIVAQGARYILILYYTILY